jgi:hypothetical protein
MSIFQIFSTPGWANLVKSSQVSKWLPSRTEMRWQRRPVLAARISARYVRHFDASNARLTGPDPNAGGNAGAMARMVAVLMLALPGNTAQAQSASDFRLPEPTPSSATRAPGPVDPENPGASTPRPAADAIPARTASPRAVPLARATTPPVIRPGTPATRPTPQATPRAAINAAPRGPILAVPGETLTTAPLITAPTATPSSPVPSLSPLISTAAPVPAIGGSAWWWPWLAAGSAALAALFALLWWRRRRTTGDAVTRFEMPVVTARQPVPVPPEPMAETQPAIAPIPSGLVLSLQATRLSASLLATTLSYRLTLTNHGTDSLAGLAIEGDMVSAHASLPPEQQMAQTGQALELRHALATLAAGETAEFSGDIRLALAAITPIRAGEQAYFVPLARFRVEAGAAGGSAVVIARTFVIGDVPDGPQTTLKPFRLDLGPRTYSRVSQREVD